MAGKSFLCSGAAASVRLLGAGHGPWHTSGPQPPVVYPCCSTRAMGTCPQPQAPVPGHTAGEQRARLTLGTGLPTARSPCLPEERIYGFLKASEPCKALRVAQALGMRTAKEVNPTLYRMKSRRLLDQDPELKVWRVSGPGRPPPPPSPAVPPGEATTPRSQSSTSVLSTWPAPFTRACQQLLGVASTGPWREGAAG